MVFSSNLFLFGFMPIFFFLYYVIPWRLKNTFIFITSILFYEFGAGKTVIVLLGSILFNYFVGRWIESTDNVRARKNILIFAVILNLIFLLFYKYTGFFWDVVNDLSHGELLSLSIPKPNIELPIGISFFTFQAISYITDIYSRHCKSARTIFDFGMYHSLFPQLIAGPIVRYSEIESKIVGRDISVNDINLGMYRFITGLAKKVVIADSVGAIANNVFNLPIDSLSPFLSWLGASAYTLQIYFDFSGYSDMAIGLGILLGFTFPENFNQPYTSQSITDFWRRWHMTLSRWFKDYVYIPLGGNRKTSYRTYFNLFVVFFICGLWHGAGFAFLVWGLFHGTLLIIERLMLEKWKFAPSGMLGRFYTMLMLMIGWVFFRSDTVSYATKYLFAMFNIFTHLNGDVGLYDVCNKQQLFFMFVGALLALTPHRSLFFIKNGSHMVLKYSASILLFFYSLALLSVHTFNPFLYFRF